MSERPLILISPSVEKRGVEFHDLSASLSLRYESAVAQAGGLPMAMPATTERALIADCVRRADGVLLTGGDDVSPGLYASRLPARVRKTVGVSPDGGARDVREMTLIDEVFRQRKPVLAICRGHQLLNVALGGTLVADIASQIPTALNHQRMDQRDRPVHEARLTPGSLLAKITRRDRLSVNSTHHQAVAQVADPLRVTARSDDGIVEGLELKPEAAHWLPFLLAVQFHPERLAARHPEHRAIFCSFTRACAR